MHLPHTLRSTMLCGAVMWPVIRENAYDLTSGNLRTFWFGRCSWIGVAHSFLLVCIYSYIERTAFGDVFVIRILCFTTTNSADVTAYSRYRPFTYLLLFYIQASRIAESFYKYFCFIRYFCSISYKSHLSLSFFLNNEIIMLTYLILKICYVPI